MAAGEARAAWQRTANRCFVQEDAKRAPKLACPSSTYSSKQPDAGPTNTPDGLENSSLGFMPMNRNTSHSNLPPESRWWLQFQPSHIYQSGLTNEQVMEDCEAKTEKETCSEMWESYELLEMDSIGSSESKKVDDLGLDPDSPWCGSGRSDPWWRVADRDELASLVSQRSLDFIENCDLPQPQSRSTKKDPHDFLGNYDCALKAQKSDLPSPLIDIDGIFACKTTSFEEQGLYGLQKQSSNDTIPKSSTRPLENDDHTKVQLMEALRHSQTRAREAEKAAKQAKAEKEHVLKLFFKQASHLFAYKQWFQLLQLENIYSHIKNSNFPVDLAFNPNKDSKLPKERQKPAKAKKRGKRAREPEQDFGKFAVAFALGLGLVGAGLFLGWTVAWMLPAL